jgi:hypothetical protein
MPLLALLHLLIGIGLAYHARQHGKPDYWMYILLFIPGVGSLAYVLLEVLPDLAFTRRGRRVSSGLTDIIDPDREWKRRYEEATRTDSVDTKRALAEECERKGMWSEAVHLYETAAQGIFVNDETVLFGLARAQLAAGDAKAAEATLTRLREAHPKLTHQEGHLLYARALETQGRLAEAAEEYQALAGYYTGLEARVRYALLLTRMGEPARARGLMEEVVRSGTARKHQLFQTDRDWLKVARANLS